MGQRLGVHSDGCVCVCVWVRVCARTCVCVHASVRASARARVCVRCVRARAHAHVRVVCACTCVCACAKLCVPKNSRASRRSAADFSFAPPARACAHCVAPQLSFVRLRIAAERAARSTNRRRRRPRAGGTHAALCGCRCAGKRDEAVVMIANAAAQRSAAQRGRTSSAAW